MFTSKQKKFVSDPLLKGFFFVFLFFFIIIYLSIIIFDFINSKNFFKSKKINLSKSFFIKNEGNLKNFFVEENILKECKKKEKDFIVDNKKLINLPTLTDLDLDILYNEFFAEKIEKKPLNKLKISNVIEKKKIKNNKNEIKKIEKKNNFKKKENLNEKKIEAKKDEIKEVKTIKIEELENKNLKTNKGQNVKNKNLKNENKIDQKISNKEILKNEKNINIPEKIKEKFIEKEFHFKNESENKKSEKTAVNEKEINEILNNLKNFEETFFELKEDEVFDEENSKEIDFKNESSDFLIRLKKLIFRFPGKKTPCKIEFSTFNNKIENVNIKKLNDANLPKAYEIHILSNLYRMEIPKTLINKNLRIVF